MRTDGNVARQVALERGAVDLMYQRLDELAAQAHAARRKALATETESAEDLYARDVEIARLTRAIAELRAGERALCFGRVDASGGDSVYIGRKGLRGEEDGAVLLVDWRAEAARPFYTATAASPMGVRRRRHLRLDDRRVVAVTDEILDGSTPTDADVIGDGPLLEALGQARTGRMREAVATLQAEQDTIVRSPHQGVTVVQGGPGTGKTIVALHRAAYVLYAHPRVAKQGVLLFGPNRRFLDYICDVLPSLGENDAQLATVADLVGLAPDAGEPDAAARTKGRAEMAAALAGWVRERQPHGVPLAVRIGLDTVTLRPETVDRARREAFQGATGHNRARGVFKESVVDELVELLEKQTEQSLEDIDADVASVLGIDLDKAVAHDLRALGLDGSPAAAGAPGFDPDRVRAALLDDAALDAAIETVWPRLHATDALRQFLAERAAAGGFPTAEEAAPPAPRSRESGLTRADLVLLDEARSLIDGPPEAVFGHIVVDEGQELTEMEWRMIMRRCPSRSMTVVGDFAQAGSATTIPSWSAALAPFVGTRFTRHTLTVNYRSTAEILAVASPLLERIAPDQDPSRSIRHGDPPRTFEVADAELPDAVRRHVLELAAQFPDELIGVVGADGRTAALAAALEGTGASVVPAREVRGLEFDTVLVIDPPAMETGRATGTRDLYVAVTRANKRLFLYRPPAG
ncbi:AAA family ATPase [Streptomyces bathyalis]|uniref:AAA family ATPase n=1 Tax=Streptomyces bathyalis TaxID=2710756 RepID=A0A7T1TAT9_9ACTN|nr:ATP-binding domain-containing protein [Streptomyces bathyalis]QPP09569.1 AAA family ATPase [Streptomyces bathyalis]